MNGVGGGIFNYGTLTVSGSTLAGNSCRDTGIGYTCSGAAIYTGGNATVQSSTLSGNVADHDGGGIFNFGTLSVSGCTLSGKSANGVFNGSVVKGVRAVASSTKASHSHRHHGVR